MIQIAMDPIANGANAMLGLINKYAPVNAKIGQTIARKRVPNIPYTVKLGTRSNSLKFISTSFVFSIKFIIS